MENKKVLYVTTKNIDYIRNAQIIRMLKKQYSDVEILFSKRKNYYIRIIEVNIKLIMKKRKKYDIVFYGFLPQLIFSCFYKKKNSEQKIVADFIISLFDVLVFDRKKVKKNSILAMLLKKIDQRIISKSDIVYTDTNTQARYFKSLFRIDNNKLKVVYFESNDLIYKKEVKGIEKRDNEFRVLWFGTVLPLQGLNTILKSAELLEQKDNIKFYIIGNLKRIKTKNYKNVTFINWITQEKLAEYIKSADLCLAGHFSGKIERANRVIPGKAYIYHSMGKKMILGESEANREKFSENSKDIFYVKRGNPEELVKKIEEISIMK